MIVCTGARARLYDENVMHTSKRGFALVAYGMFLVCSSDHYANAATETAITALDGVALVYGLPWMIEKKLVRYVHNEIPRAAHHSE